MKLGRLWAHFGKNPHSGLFCKTIIHLCSLALSCPREGCLTSHRTTCVLTETKIQIKKQNKTKKSYSPWKTLQTGDMLPRVMSHLDFPVLSRSYREQLVLSFNMQINSQEGKGLTTASHSKLSTRMTKTRLSHHVLFLSST